MSARQFETLINQYLDRVSAELRDLPESDRAEIIGDLRSHIEDAIAESHAVSEVEVRNVLERIGDPTELARESRERLSGETSNAAPVYRRVKTGPGALEVIGIVLTALFWPIGILLVWLSDRWRTRDKLIGTVIPVVGFALLITMTFPVYVGGSESELVVDEIQEVTGPAYPAPGTEPLQAPAATEIREVAQPGASSSFGEAAGRLLLVLGFIIGVIGSPFIAAIYLAFRLQPVEETLYPDGTSAEHRVAAGGPA